MGIVSAFVIRALLDPSAVRSVLEDYTPPVPTRILDIKGRVITEFYLEKREVIPYEDIPPALVAATLSTEDEHFFSHYGFNPWRIGVAFFVNLVNFRAEQGGSTITVQLSKLIFLHRRKTIDRKIRELWYAIQIEKIYTKKEILWFYFNHINYGHGCYGVEAAAKFFFGKSAKELTIAECSLLAGIPKSPNKFSPIREPEQSRKRHHLVLHNLVRTGYLTKVEALNAFDDFWLEWNSRVRNEDSTVANSDTTLAPYFVEYVRERLEKIYDREKLYSGGLVVHTTLNLDHQRVAEREMQKALEEQDQIYKRAVEPIKLYSDAFIYDPVNALGNAFWLKLPTAQTKHNNAIREALDHEAREPLKEIALFLGQSKLFNILHYSGDAKLEASTQARLGFTQTPTIDNVEEKAQGSFISIEPSTGYITAMVGGSGFHYRNQFNHVFLAHRQVGSTIKPFVYAPALDKKVITPATIIPDLPIAYAGNVASPDGLYVPKNYDGEHLGSILAREALRHSVNTCALQVMDMVGANTVREYGKNFFQIKTDREMDEKFPRDATMGLGTGSFTPYELTRAFATFANEGKEVIPLAIRYITDRRGAILTNFEKGVSKNSRNQIVSPATAYLITDMLHGVLESGGTGWRPELDGFKHHSVSSGKTGTTGNWTDAWFVGYNHYLVTSVWIGYDSNKSLGLGRTGGQVAVPVWIAFNKETLNPLKPIPFRTPSDVVHVRVSPETGKLEGPSTRNGYEEVFARGTEPTEFDDSAAREYREKMNFIDRARGNNKNKDVKNFLELIKKGDSNK